MSDQMQQDDELDRLLSGHFSTELDQYTGRAGDRFLASSGPVTNGRPAMRLVGATTDRANDSGSRPWRIWWAAPLLAAAAAIAMVAWPAVKEAMYAPGMQPGPAMTERGNPGASGSTGAQRPGNGEALQTVSYEPRDVAGQAIWETRDEGVVWLDENTPARRIRTLGYKTLEWTDPRDSARIQVTVPREEVMLVSSPKY